MIPDKEKIINKLKEAKELYGLNYATLARDIGLQPVSIYMFVNGKVNLSKSNQLKAVCFAERYIEKVKQELRILEHRGVCINE